MVFINLNLNLKQSRVSIRIPEQLCSSKLEQELKENNQPILDTIFRLLTRMNSDRFQFKPTNVRQFNWSKNDKVYYLNFLIDCDIEHVQLNNQDCEISIPSDKEMSLDYAYCCGNNQEIHLKTLNLSKLSDASSANLDQLYILFAKQKLFTKFLIESANQTDYLILKLLSNRCLIAFHEFFECEAKVKQIDTSSTDAPLDKLIETRSAAIKPELKEAIFVEFKHLNLNTETDEVKTYRYSFDCEFMQLDNELFNKLVQSLNQLNKSIPPTTAQFDNATKFKYSYLLDRNQ